MCMYTWTWDTKAGLENRQKMRRERYTKPFVMLLLLARLSPGALELGDGDGGDAVNSGRAIEGTYKYLIFPQGSNVQLVYCLTIGALSKPTGVFTVGVTAGLAYELPYRRTVPYRKPAEVYHRRSRRDLYRKIEFMLKTQGKDGRGCVLKALCQAGKRNRETTASAQPNQRTSFLEEILHSVFTFPEYFGEDEYEDEGDEGEEASGRKRRDTAEYDRAYGARDDCEKLFASCPRLF